MKTINQKNLSLACLMLLSFATVNLSAQDETKHVEFGVRFMPTLTSFDMKTSSGGTVAGSGVFGWGASAFLGYNFTPNIGVQVEGIYTSISQKYKEVNVEREINLKYINIPLLLSLNTGKQKMVNFNIVAGPQIGLSVGSSVFSSGGDSTNVNAVLQVKKGDLGLAYGAGLDFGLNEAKTIRLGIGFRGVYGLLDISDNNGTTSNGNFYIIDKAQVKTYSGYVGLSVLF